MTTTKSKVFDDRESDAFDKIIEAMSAVINVDERGPMKYNREEIAAAVHVLQSTVQQHALWRMDPEYFSDWWEPGESRA